MNSTIRSPCSSARFVGPNLACRLSTVKRQLQAALFEIENARFPARQISTVAETRIAKHANSR